MPTRKPNRKRQKQFVLRLTDAEYEALAKAAKGVCMTLSGYALFKLGLDVGDTIGAAIVERIQTDDATLRSHDL